MSSTTRGIPVAAVLAVAVALAAAPAGVPVAAGTPAGSLAAQEAGPPDGSLVLVGGAMRDPAIVRRFVELAGGPDAPIVVIPTAGGADGGAHYLFGRLEQRTASLTTRVDYTFSPDLSLQLYAQPFVSAGDYSRFREVRDPGASSFDTRFRTYPDDAVSEVGGPYSVDRDGDGEPELEFGDPDFNIRQLRSNLVLRWEYMPGSRVFLVWSQDRSGFAPDGSFRLGRDLDALFGADGRNVFLVKIEHWLGL